MNTDTQRDALKAQLLDSIRIKELSAGHPLMKPAFEIRERELRTQIEALEYADKLAQGLPDGMLPKDIEVLREANCGLAMELTAVTEQRDEVRETLESLTTTAFDLLAAFGRAREERDKEREIYQKSYSAELARSNHYKHQRDRLAEALKACREDSVELLGERVWWQYEPRCVYQKRYQETRDNVTRADEALQSLTTNDKGEAQPPAKNL